MPRPRPPGHRPFGRRPFAPVALTAVLGISLLIGVGVTARPPEPAPVKVSVTRPATPSVAAPKPTPPAPVSRTVALRWSVPEPRLVQGKVTRPLLHREARLTLSPAQLEQVQESGSLAGLRPELDRVYAQIEARTPGDVRFIRAGAQWVGEARTGWTVNRAASEKALLRALESGAQAAALSVTLTAPERSVRWAAARELTHLGTGESSFTGSPDFRVYNIRTGAARVDGAWVATGRTFSFNALIGSISAATGFRPGYVVTGNTLSTEDGGGICQVSTTVFRAAFRAGLPITERHAHSYQVAYYGDPGLDAAVYAPSKDLRWRNDTGGPVLVQVAWDLKAQELTVSIFGAADGRRVQIAAPVISERRNAPEPSFMVDRALKGGEARRVDMPAPGLRARVTRTVTYADGERRVEQLDSRYRAWGGVFAVAPGDDRLR